MEGDEEERESNNGERGMESKALLRSKKIAQIEEEESSVCCHKCVVAMRADSVLKPG